MYICIIIKNHVKNQVGFFWLILDTHLSKSVRQHSLTNLCYKMLLWQPLPSDVDGYLFLQFDLLKLEFLKSHDGCLWILIL